MYNICITYRPFKNEAHNMMNLVSINIAITAIVWVTYSRVVKSIPLWPVNITVGAVKFLFLPSYNACCKLVLFLRTYQFESSRQEEI